MYIGTMAIKHFMHLGFSELCRVWFSQSDCLRDSFNLREYYALGMVNVILHIFYHRMVGEIIYRRETD